MKSDQSSIAKQLKGLAIAVGFAGLIFSCIIGRYMSANIDVYGWPMIVILFITIVLCYACLVLFWKVCTQIGRDNSFSLQNSTYFSKMSLIMAGVGGLWTGYLIVYLITGNSGNKDIFILVKIIELAVLFFAASFLTRMLAKLIDKAREIREENDLTI